MECAVAKAIRYQQRLFSLRALPNEAVLEDARLSQTRVDHREERDIDRLLILLDVDTPLRGFMGD